MAITTKKWLPILRRCLILSKFLFFTDSHFSAHFTEFSKPIKEYINDRFQNQCKVLSDMLTKAREDNLPVIFGGDLFDVRNQIDIEDFNYIFKIFAGFPDVKCYLLRGNHDSVNNLMGSPSSIDSFNYLENKQVISNPEHLEISDVDFYFVPYGENIKEIQDTLSEFSKMAKENDNAVLVAHLGVNGANMNGMKSDSQLYPKDFYPDIFNFVYLGHYHLRQKIANLENMFYGGSLFQNTFSDSGSVKGYDIIDINNGCFEDNFIQHHLPEFDTVTVWDDTAKELANSGNYVRLKSENKEDIQEAKKSSNVRTELQKTFKVNSRLDIKKDDSPLLITKKYLEKNNIDAFDEAKEILKSLE